MLSNVRIFFTNLHINFIIYCLPVKLFTTGEAQVREMTLSEVLKFLENTDLDTLLINGLVDELREAFQQWV